MTEERKKLYRELLHWAMVDIKHHSHSRSFSFNLWHRRSHRARLRFALAITQWLHNLALLSAYDFDGFREDWFWRGYTEFRQEFPADRWAPFTESVIEELRKQS